MKMSSNNELVFLGVSSLKAKETGVPFELVQVADPVSFDKFEFFRRDDINLVGLHGGDKVLCEFDVTRRGFANQINLVGIVKA